MGAAKGSAAAVVHARRGRPVDDSAAVEVATRLAVAVQECVERWRPHERHSIGGQLFRASLSVSANLVEARSRRSAKERLRFVEIADGSLQEAGHLVSVASDVRLLVGPDLERVRALHEAATREVARRRRNATAAARRDATGAARRKALGGAAKRARKSAPAQAAAEAGAEEPTTPAATPPRGRAPAPSRERARALALPPAPTARGLALVTTGAPRERKKPGRPAAKVALGPADPFELIRWLARSQSDPRKAVAELVQNSLDAGARQIEIRRQRIRKRLCLVVRDDGEGVLPGREREDALRHIATHVGHSHKMRLDAAERAARVVAGKYGVGLLGFWSIGRTLELRTRVGGSPLHALRLVEDSPSAEIDRLPLATDAPETFTEVVIADVHDAAQRALSGRRLTDYLATELRGQLLAREVEIVIYDHVARGTAQKRFVVVPRRFTGERLDVPSEVPVLGHASARVELYVARGVERPAVEVACAGTRVADDIAELRALGLDRAPWVGRELSGVIDFPSFSVPPGTRRGVAPDRAALAFAGAMEALAPVVEAELDRLEEERRAALDRDVHRELRQALRGLARRLPEFELPRVEGRGARELVDAGPGARIAERTEREGPDGAGSDAARTSEAGDEGAVELEAPALFPPGPLAAVQIVPATARVAPGGERRLSARAVDADGRPVLGVTYVWRLESDESAGIALREGGARPAVCARPDAALGGSGVIRVEAHRDGVAAEASATVEVASRDDASESALGIPEPHLVSDAAGLWRSRMRAGRWEVNDAHEDYQAVRPSPRGRMRYLLTLLAREIVLRTAARPDAADLVDGVVAILAHAERNLRGR